MFSSRGYTTGMFFGKQPDSDYNFDGESYRMSHELVGVVMEVNGGSARIALRNRLDKDDSIEYLAPGLEGICFTVDSMFDEEGAAITSARNEDVITINVPHGVRGNDLIRRKKGVRSIIKLS
jgi:putative protease